ncbi:hypothetical protein J6590_084822 [Homalodisca vitripennis]|nr:hypothetical protein J6590_084822 [Homalodisca vitripennis]
MSWREKNIKTEEQGGEVEVEAGNSKRDHAASNEHSDSPSGWGANRQIELDALHQLGQDINQNYDQETMLQVMNIQTLLVFGELTVRLRTHYTKLRQDINQNYDQETMLQVMNIQTLLVVGGLTVRLSWTHYIKLGQDINTNCDQETMLQVTGIYSVCGLN